MFSKDGDRKGEFYRTMGLYQSSLTLERSRNARYYIECPDGEKVIPPEGKRWRVVEESYKKMLDEGNIELKKLILHLFLMKRAINPNGYLH